jgi:cytochrome P450
MVLPLGTPIKGLDGTQINEIPIPKSTRIFVNIVGSNVDPTIWGEDSHEWKPERWLRPLPDSVSSARIPGVYSNLSV